MRIGVYIHTRAPAYMRSKTCGRACVKAAVNSKAFVLLTLRPRMWPLQASAGLRVYEVRRGLDVLYVADGLAVAILGVHTGPWEIWGGRRNHSVDSGPELVKASETSVPSSPFAGVCVCALQTRVAFAGLAFAFCR